MDGDRAEIRWPPRVPKQLLARLYQSDAAGLLDGDLVDEVGHSLYLRCRAILDIAEAKRGRVRCPRCAGQQRQTIIQQAPRQPLIQCPVCAWRLTWRQYHRSYARRQLNSGGAMPSFRSFVEAWEQAPPTREKWLLIDRLIHEFHYSNRHNPTEATRPVGPNLIEGNLRSVVEFLDALSTSATPDTRGVYDRWKATYQAGYWPVVFAAEEDQGT